MDRHNSNRLAPAVLLGRYLLAEKRLPAELAQREFIASIEFQKAFVKFPPSTRQGMSTAKYCGPALGVLLTIERRFASSDLIEKS